MVWLTPGFTRRCEAGKTPDPTHDFSGKARIPYAAQERSVSKPLLARFL